MSEATVRLDHDDNIIDVLDKLNKALAAHGLEFVDDEEEHDGFMILKLVKGASPIAADGTPNALSALAADTVRDLRARIGVDIASVFVCRAGDGATGAALDTGTIPYSTGAMIAVEGIVNVHNAVLHAAAKKATENR